jgi:hypothetical protein
VDFGLVQQKQDVPEPGKLRVRELQRQKMHWLAVLARKSSRRWTAEMYRKGAHSGLAYSKKASSLTV